MYVLRGGQRLPAASRMSRLCWKVGWIGLQLRDWMIWRLPVILTAAAGFVAAGAAVAVTMISFVTSLVTSFVTGFSTICVTTTSFVTIFSTVCGVGGVPAHAWRRGAATPVRTDHLRNSRRP